jgi:hypothetical protein
LVPANILTSDIGWYFFREKEMKVGWAKVTIPDKDG